MRRAGADLVATLYALAMYGLSLPRVAVTGKYGFQAARTAMPYKLGR